MPWNLNTVVAAARLNYLVQICHSTTNSPIQNRNQDIINTVGPVSHQWIKSAEKLKTSIDGFFAEDRGLKHIFSKIIGCNFAYNSSINVNSHCRMKSRSNAIFTQNPNFINLGNPSVNTTDKLGSVSVPTTRLSSTDVSVWIWKIHDIEEATEDRVIKREQTVTMF